MTRWPLAAMLAVGLLAACDTAAPPAPEAAPEDDGGLISVLSVDGTVTGDKTVADADIQCDGSTTVTLTLDGQTGIAGNPVDIMLVLDRSGSMAGSPMSALKSGASAFVDIIDEATDGALDGVISNGSRIGVVSFASGASLNQAPTTSAGSVKSAINALSASGTTNHEAAFQAAAPHLASGDVLIMFTDGQTTAGGDPDNDAAALRAAGVEIFAIGLGSVNVAQLNDWATDPNSSHVSITPSPGDLQAIFEALGAAIVVPAATNVSVVDTVSDHFTVSDAVASKGGVAVAGNVLTWTLDSLATETVTLTYTVTHDNTRAGGTEIVNASVVYSDAEGKTVTFPSPTVDVHGCAASLALTPEASDNTVGDDHTVTATVLDDFGAPIAGLTVDFAVTGGLSIVDGEPSDPQPPTGSGATDAAGQTSFTYTNAEAAPDTITAWLDPQPYVSQDRIDEGVLTDTASKTWLPIEAAVDLHPTSCPNPLQLRAGGVLPAAILGMSDFDVNDVDATTVMLYAPAGSVAPDRTAYEDVATPYEPLLGKTGRLDCTTAGADGFTDLTLKFDARDVVSALGAVSADDVVVLRIGGEIGGLDFLGEDVAWIR